MEPAERPLRRSPLRGRSRELAVVRAALGDPRVRLVAIGGPSGAGKSALADAALGDPAFARLLVGAGQFAPDNAYGAAPLVAAVDAALAGALDELYDPDAALEALAAALGDTAQAFAGLSGGALGQLAGPAVDRSRVVGIAAAAERLAQALVGVGVWLCALRGQLLLRLDDWGRGGPETAVLLARLLADVPGLCILATERTEERFPLDPLLAVLRIELSPLDAQARQAILIDQLDGDRRIAREVAAFLGDQAVLPADLVDAVSVLKAAGGLSRTDADWTFAPSRGAQALGGEVASRVAGRLAVADDVARAVAEALALFGEATDLRHLAAVTGLSTGQVADAIEALSALGLARRDRDRASFSHDRVLAAVLAGMDPGARIAGLARLADALRAAGVRPAAFGAGAAMLNGRLAAGLETADPETWTALCREGAEQARAAGAGGKAAEWAAAALSLARRHGAVAPEVLREAVYSAVELGDFTGGRALADEMLSVSVGLQGQAEADEMRALVRRAAGDIDGAIAIAREALSRFGVRMPDRAERLRLAWTAVRVITADVAAARRHGRVPAEALDIYAPLIRTLNASGSLLYEQEPMRAVLLAVTGVPMRLVAGTAAGAATYSVLCAAFGAFRQGERWARLSDELQGPGQPARAVALQYSTNFGYATVRPRLSAAARVATMEQMAYAEGDLPVAAYANRRRALDTVFGDATLGRMATELEARLQTARRLGDQPTLVTIEALRQFVNCLSGSQPTPWRLAGEHFDVAAFERSPLALTTHAPRHVHVLEALLAAAFGAWESGAALHDRTLRYFRAPALQLLPQTWFFATALALRRTGRRPSPWRMAVLRRHARHNPTDHLHRVLLLEAEAARTRGDAAGALAGYEQALSAAGRSRCTLEHGIVAAVAADGAAGLGHPEAARRHAAERDAVWRQFGAAALLTHHGVAPHETAAALSPPEPALRELELNAARAGAERTSRAKSRLLAEIAHELRTPLQGAVELLADPDGAAEPRDAAALRDTLRHLSTVVDDLADMGALEAGGVALACRPFDLRATVAQACAMHATAAGARRIAVGGDRCPALLGDDVRIRQIVSNLVSNALKHGRGAVTVDTRAARHGSECSVGIEVSDEGPGLSDQALATIFEPFRRGSDAQDAEGLGLGLPIARRLAQAMGGDLTARARDGRTTFILQVRLPLAKPAPARRAAGLPTRVLLAEDVDLSRRVLSRLLTAEGCDVHEARDGEAALQVWADRDIERVLTDQRMPGLTGAALCRRLRDAGFAGPIAIAAGVDDPELRAQVADLEDVVVLRKPVDRATLRGWLSRDPADVAPRPDLARQRIADLVEALGPAARAIFAELPGEVETLLTGLEDALRAGEAESSAEAAHRLAGLAEHFGLVDLAGECRRLERLARDRPTDLPPAPEAARALRAAVGRIDWRAFEADPIAAGLGR